MPSAAPRGGPGRPMPFRVIAWFMAISGAAFGLFTAVFGIVAESQRIHAVHNAVVATLLLVLSAPAAAVAARDPERSTPALVHLSVVGIAGLVTMALALTLDPFTLPFIVLVGVLWMLRPNRQPVLPPGRPSAVLLVLALAAAVPLAVYALGQAELQRADASSEHAELFHWVETSFYALAVPLLGLLAGFRPRVYRLSAWAAGIALAVLGAASIAFPDRASALDTAWAWATLAGGIAFVAAAEWERTRHRDRRSSGSGRGGT